MNLYDVTQTRDEEDTVVVSGEERHLVLQIADDHSYFRCDYDVIKSTYASDGEVVGKLLNEHSYW